MGCPARPMEFPPVKGEADWRAVGKIDDGVVVDMGAHEKQTSFVRDLTVLERVTCTYKLEVL